MAAAAAATRALCPMAAAGTHPTATTTTAAANMPPAAVGRLQPDHRSSLPHPRPPLAASLSPTFAFTRMSRPRAAGEVTVRPRGRSFRDPSAGGGLLTGLAASSCARGARLAPTVVRRNSTPTLRCQHGLPTLIFSGSSRFAAASSSSSSRRGCSRTLLHVRASAHQSSPAADGQDGPNFPKLPVVGPEPGPAYLATAVDPAAAIQSSSSAAAADGALQQLHSEVARRARQAVVFAAAAAGLAVAAMAAGAPRLGSSSQFAALAAPPAAVATTASDDASASAAPPAGSMSASISMPRKSRAAKPKAPVQSPQEDGPPSPSSGYQGENSGSSSSSGGGSGSSKKDSEWEALAKQLPSDAELEDIASLDEAHRFVALLRRAHVALQRESKRTQDQLLDELVVVKADAEERRAELTAARERRKEAREGGGAKETKGGAVELVFEDGGREEGVEAEAPRRKSQAGRGVGTGGVSVKALRRAADAAQKRVDEVTKRLLQAQEQAGTNLAALSQRLRFAEGRARELVGLPFDAEEEEAALRRFETSLAQAAAKAGGLVQVSMDKPEKAAEAGQELLRWVIGEGSPAVSAASTAGEEAEAAEESTSLAAAAAAGAAVGAGAEDRSVAEMTARRQKLAAAWRKWAVAQKSELRRKMKEDPALAQEYSRLFQDDVLATRDRVMRLSWYNPRESRWEMSPLGVWEGNSLHLFRSATFRQDRRAAVVTLHGDARDFFVDLSLFDALKDETGGGVAALEKAFEAAGVETGVTNMWVPLDEWDFWAVFRLPVKVLARAAQEASELGVVRAFLPWYLRTTKEAAEEIFLRLVFPVLPGSVKTFFKVDYTQGASAGDEVALDRMGYMMAIERRVSTEERQEGWPWWIRLTAKTWVVTYPMRYMTGPVVAVVGGLFLAPPLPENEVQYKDRLSDKLERRMKGLLGGLVGSGGGLGKGKDDDELRLESVREAFNRMKRVRRPEVSLSDFAGMDSVKEEVAEVIAFLRDPRRFQEMGARPPRGVLITGPSGTGKTALAMAIAAEARVPVVEIRESDINPGGFVGQAASNVRELFLLAREMAPMIIFMENFETIGGVRGTTLNTKLQDKETLINQLLVELDGFETQEGVVLLAITDSPELVDPALRRPGRMDRVIEVPLPNLQERESILRRAALNSMKPHLADAVDWRLVAEQTRGFKPAELKGVPQRLVLAAGANKPADEDEIAGITNWLEVYNFVVPAFVRRWRPLVRQEERLVEWLGLAVTPDDLRATVPNIDFSGVVSGGGMDYMASTMDKWDREAKLPHAIWAAGRGLLAALLPSFDRVDNIWLDPGSWEGIGFTRLTRTGEGVMALGTGAEESSGLGFAAAAAASVRGADGDEGEAVARAVGSGGGGGALVRTRSYVEKQLVLLFGSHAAALMLLPWGMSNNLATRQLLEACKLAEEMVVECGWGPDSAPMILRAEGSQQMLAMGHTDKEELNRKIQTLHEAAFERAYAILQRNRATLEALVDHLCEVEAVDHAGLMQLMEETGAVQEEDPFQLFAYVHPLERMKNETPRWGFTPSLLARLREQQEQQHTELQPSVGAAAALQD